MSEEVVLVVVLLTADIVAGIAYVLPPLVVETAGDRDRGPGFIVNGGGAMLWTLLITGKLGCFS